MGKPKDKSEKYFHGKLKHLVDNDTAKKEMLAVLCQSFELYYSLREAIAKHGSLIPTERNGLKINPAIQASIAEKDRIAKFYKLLLDEKSEEQVVDDLQSLMDEDGEEDEE